MNVVEVEGVAALESDTAHFFDCVRDNDRTNNRGLQWRRVGGNLPNGITTVNQEDVTLDGGVKYNSHRLISNNFVESNSGVYYCVDTGNNQTLYILLMAGVVSESCSGIENNGSL